MADQQIDPKKLKTLMNRIERLDAALAELEGESAGTRDAITWSGNLAALGLPELDQVVGALQALVARFETLVDGEGFARFAARMREEGDNRDPLAVYQQSHARLATTDSLPVDSRAINERNSRFWEREGVRPSTPALAARKPRPAPLRISAQEALDNLAERRNHDNAANHVNREFWAKQSVK